MSTIYIDNQSYEVNAKQNLLQQCLSHGLNIPYFCWHPALGSVGACRQCAVKQYKDENDTKGRIVMACMTPAKDGIRISVNDPEVIKFRATIIEWLMENHPHDCPVCDEGGECHLQDMTVLTGHAYRRYRFKKRTFRNQDLGPFISHEMNRCITCYRCVRFYQDYAGGKDLDSFASKNHVYFGRHKDGILENDFCGNLVEICPTGVFTDKTLKHHFTRKWDLQTAPSVCVHCAVGCNIIPGERYGGLRRILNRYNGEINGYFICDRGRFGYDFVNNDRRLRSAFIRRQKSDELTPVTTSTALDYLSTLLQSNTKVIGIGSPRASVEANYALRSLVGPERFYAGMSAAETRLLATAVDIFKTKAVRSPSPHDIEQADAVLILGEDINNYSPRLALSVRQSIRHPSMVLADKVHIHRWMDRAVRQASALETSGPLYIATPFGTRLDDIATKTFRASSEDIARLGFAVAHELNMNAPPVAKLSKPMAQLAKEIAQVLKQAARPVVISGSGCGSKAVIQAAANVAMSLNNNDHTAELFLCAPECNSMGLSLMTDRSIEAAFKAVEDGTADTAIILENDLYRRAERSYVDTFFNTAKHTIVLDHLAHDTASNAEVVLPVGTFAEVDGTLISSEGRAQRYYQVFKPDEDIRESWRWLHDLIGVSGAVNHWPTLDDVIHHCVTDMPQFKGMERAAPAADFRIAGQKIPREPHRYSGRTSIHANIHVSEHKPPEDADAPFSYTMEGYSGPLPAALIPFYWTPHWNSVQALNKFQIEVGGPLRGGDPGVRLIEPNNGQVEYFSDVPAGFKLRSGEYLILPIQHIFGSEELSLYSSAVAQLAPAPYLLMSSEDMKSLKINATQQVELSISDSIYRLPVQINETLPKGIIGLPVGLPGLTGIELPTWGKLTPGQNQ